MKKLSCIIFDIDGTLTQTNELIFSSINHISEKYTGKIHTPSEITAMFGPPEDIAIERLVGKDFAEIALTDFLNFYTENHAKLARLYPEMTEILDFLKEKRIILAVFTGKGKHTTLITLEKFGIKKYFDLIVTGNDVVNHKPSSEGIKKILDFYHVHPDETLMVGDAVADVTAAHEAGIPIAAVVWDSYGKEKVIKMDVDYLFDNVNSLKLFFKELLN